MIHPSLASDVDGTYRGRDQKVHRVGEISPNVTRVTSSKRFKVYSVFSLWDTYRALHPLLSIIDRERTVDFVRSFLLQYQQGGKLPVWELGSCETECMIGYHSVSVIADVILKEIGVEKDVNGKTVYPFDYNLALEAMVHSAKLKDSAFMDFQGNPLGYMGVENTAESVSKLLEYAYDDWCIARVAYVLKKDDIAKAFFVRSERWKNVYDEKVGFMRPRVNGGWLSPEGGKQSFYGGQCMAIFDVCASRHHGDDGSVWWCFGNGETFGFIVWHRFTHVGSGSSRYFRFDWSVRPRQRTESSHGLSVQLL
jgi:putative alpha-1,2-mannosidase